MATEQIEITVNGAVIYFAISADSDRRVLDHHWNEAGFGARVPAPRREGSSLRAALQYVFKQTDEAGAAKYLVRSLSDGGLSVQREDRGTSANHYVQIVTARIAEGGGLDLAVAPSEDPTGEIDKSIRDNFAIERDRLTGAQVARAFVDALVINLGATTLRAAGGVYWIPDAMVTMVEKLALGIECASLADGHSTGERSQVYLMRTAQDETAAKAISAAITAEVTAEIARIEAAVADGTTLGPRALNTRKEEAARLRAKVATYEGTLGRALDTLREGAARAEAEATRAAFAAMAEDDKARAA